MNEKDKRALCNNFIEQIEKIIVDHIPNNSPFSVSIDNYIKITNKNKTWIIVSNPIYSQLYNHYAQHNDYSIIESKLTIPNSVYQHIKNKGLTSKVFKDKTRVCQYLYKLSEVLYQCTCNESIDCDELSEIGYFDFIKLVEKKTKQFKLREYLKEYNNHIEMIVGDDTFELRFFNEKDTYSTLRFSCLRGDRVSESNKDDEYTDKNHMLNIWVTVPYKPDPISKLMRKRIKDIQKLSEYNRGYFKAQKAIEEFNSEDQVFEYLEKLFSDGIYQYYYKPINTTNKSIGIKNLSRICNVTNKSVLQQNTTGMLGHNSLEDSNDNNIAVILISVFAIFAVVILIVYYKNCYHRSPNVDAMRNRRKLKVLGKNDEQLEEKECLSTKEEDEQQSNLDNEASELSPYSGTSGYTSSSASIAENGQSPRSNTPSRTGSSSSSRSGTVSRTRSLSSTREGSQTSSDLEKVIAEDNQRSPRTSVEHVQRVGNITTIRKARGCLGESCY